MRNCHVIHEKMSCFRDSVCKAMLLNCHIHCKKCYAVNPGMLPQNARDIPKYEQIINYRIFPYKIRDFPLRFKGISLIMLNKGLSLSEFGIAYSLSNPW